MSNKKNIEDLFRSEFDNFTQAPSDKVWNGINKKMKGPRLESLYRNTFSGFKIAPAEQTWRRIAAAVWFNKFIHFTPFSFNIYYAGIILTAVVGSVVTINNNPNLDFVHFSEKYDGISKLEPKEILFDQIKDYQFELRNTKPDDFELSEDIEIENLSNEINTIDYTLVESQNQVENLIYVSEEKVSTTENIETTNVSNDVKEENIIETEETTENTTEIATSSSDNIITAESVNNLYYKLDRLIKNKKYTLTYQPTPFEIADLVINGIPEQDVISYDTLGVDYHGDPILSEKSYFALDLYFSPYMHTYNTVLLNSELNTNYDLYTENINPQFSYSAGIGFAYSYNNYRLETGIGYQQLHESFYCKSDKYETNTYSEYDYFDNEVWNYDTVLILDLDEYLQGNTVYIEHTDSTLILTPDSTLITITDSTLVSIERNAGNAYRLIDIPLIAGYEFKMGKISLTPKAGIISSVLFSRSGTYYDLSSDDVLTTENCPDTKFMFDYYAALNIQYQMGEHAGIYIEPHIRADINSMYDKTYAINQKSRKYGIRTGVYFKF